MRIARIFPAVILMAVIIIALPAIAAASAGFPMYSWGNNGSGQLGLGDAGAAFHRDTPHRVGLQTNWVQVASGGSTSIALNTNGEIFAWGAAWNAAQMGHGGVNPGMGSPLTVPVRVGSANDWVQVSARSSAASARNSAGELFVWGTEIGQGANTPTRVAPNMTFSDFTLMEQAVFAICADTGYMYSWGNTSNANGQLGQGHFTTAPLAERLTPARIASDITNWATIVTGQQHVLAITECGQLWAWGFGTSGQLGLGNSLNQHTPQRIGLESDWVTAGTTTGHASAAINLGGELWTWGATATGQLGRPAGGGAPPANQPGRVGTGEDWVFVASANNHFLAATTENRLYSWGNNTYGQLGVGDTTFRSEPTFILQSYGFADTARGGGQRSFMLMHTDPIELELDLVKLLRMPEGTTLPAAGKSFTFNFAPYSFNGNTDLAGQVPQIGDNGEVVVTVTNSSPGTTASGTTIRTESVEILSGVSFGSVGVFSWRVIEVANSSSTNASPELEQMVYSVAQYQLNIWITQEAVGQPFEVYTVEIIPLVREYMVQGQEVGVKTDLLVFGNTYIRGTQGTDDCYGALVMSKSVTGEFADRSTLFDFDVTLTGIALMPEEEFSGRIYGPGGLVGNFISFPANEPVHVQLRHDQRLVFDTLVVGTRFEVTERAIPNFIASVNLVVNGSSVTIPPNANDNTALSTGSRIIGENANSAAFTNTHLFAPPTGLVMANLPLAIPVIVSVLLFALFASRKRRTIEQLPII